MQAGEEPVSETQKRYRKPAEEGTGFGTGTRERGAEDQNSGAAVYNPGE